MNKLLELEGVKGWGELPFKVYLNFESIFEYWENQSRSELPGQAVAAKELLDYLANYPAIRGNITDVDLVFEYAEPVSRLLSVLFPQPLQLNEIKTGSVPFTNLLFNPTKRFQNIIKSAGVDIVPVIRNMDPDVFYIMACIFLLDVKFGTNFKSVRPYYLDLPKAQTGEIANYRVLINGDFSKLEANDPDFTISEADIRLLRDNAHNIDLWKSIIPPNSFTFQGFGLMTLVDVTLEEIISQLKTDLLHPEAMYSKKRLDNMGVMLRRIFKMPDIEKGFTVLKRNSNELECTGQTNMNSLILGDATHRKINECYCSKSLELLLAAKRPIIFSDLTNLEAPFQPMGDQLLKQGFKSYAAIPMELNDDMLGIVELASPHAGEINSISIGPAKDIIPIWSVAVQRWLVDHETRLEAIIQENFTAIHPAVSWRFFEAAEKHWQDQQAGRKPVMKDLVFENVFPLYGQMDIKGSTDARNNAVQLDLVAQLNLAIQVLQNAVKVEPMILYQQLIHRIKEATKSIKKGMDAGDEVTMMNFLKAEIYPAFSHIRTLNSDMNKLVDDYVSRLDSDLGFIYDKRKDFEESVAIINDRLTAHLDTAEENAQRIYPHYFEKFKTDGVEYNIYVGQSLVNSKSYEPIYLQNLQLWQLNTMIEMENLVHELWEEMPLKLEVASLILVHGSAMTIQFKMASKRFDVDGAYNIRYEIIKKRIDKALVKGRKERLTLPGRIAIVYSQDRDAETYRKYLNYLASTGKIEKQIEELELQELQGVSGLKALRVSVKYQKK